MRPVVLVAVALLVWAAAPPARAVDWPVRIPLPRHDVAVGVSGGVSFGERGAFDRREVTALGGADVSWLHGLFGLHLGIHAHPEGTGTRVGATLEASVWYVLLLGAGVGQGWMRGGGAEGVPDRVTSLSLLLAAPFPVARFDDGRAGALVLAPYFRTGLRFRHAEDVDSRHHAGLMLRWTSFGF
ncbi:MAG: hypothetical protein ACQEXJ_02540 [Myxococcota bacterium]